VRFPPGRGKLAMKPMPIGSETLKNTMGIVLVSRCRATVPPGVCHVGLQGNQLLREHRKLIAPAGREAIVDMNIAALNPSAFCEALPKCRQALLGFRIVLGKSDQRTDAPKAYRPKREMRPRVPDEGAARVKASNRRVGGAKAEAPQHWTVSAGLHWHSLPLQPPRSPSRTLDGRGRQPPARRN